MENVIQNKNYIAEFYKNTDENKYQNFFKVTSEDCKIDEYNLKVKKALAELEEAKSQLEEEYAKKYSKQYEQLNQPNLFKYSTRTGTDYYYDVTGLMVNLGDEERGNYTIRSLETKHGNIKIMDGYCYELAAFVVKEYKYNVSGDNSKCSFNLLGEMLVPFFEENVYNSHGSCWRSYSYEFDRILNEYNSTTFINKMYGIDRKFSYNLSMMRSFYQRNPAFEVIIKTAPDSLLGDLLNMRDIQKPQPVYKLLGISQKLYDEALKRGIEKAVYDLRLFIQNVEVFNKTEMEWLDLIEEMTQKQADLDFFHIEYTGYYYRHYEGCPLLGYLAERYCEVSYLHKNYSFGKFCDYVIEETINQGFTEIRLFVGELTDYLKMCHDQNITPTLFSSYLSQTHDIAARNHKVYLDVMQEEIFKKRYEGFKTITVGKDDDQYQVIAPTKSDDVKHEGDALNHCVASYIKRILDGQTQIFFLRKDPAVSLITMEVRDGKICQVRGMHNRKPTPQENKAIEEFAKKKELTLTYC